MWNQLLLSGKNASGFGFGTPTVYQVIYICVKYQVARAAKAIVVLYGGVKVLGSRRDADKRHVLGVGAFRITRTRTTLHEHFPASADPNEASPSNR
jgi:hypothetical protein